MPVPIKDNNALVCACASEVYGSVFCVCVCVCVDCYSCSMVNEVQVKVCIQASSHVLIRRFAKLRMLCSRVMPIVLLTWNAIA